MSLSCFRTSYKADIEWIWKARGCQHYAGVLGWGSPFGTDVFVSRDNADPARTIIEEYHAANELTEEELTEMALNTEIEEL